MAKEYFDRLDSLLRPVIGTLPSKIEVTTKHFFGGAAAYANGRICITLTTVGLAMKLPEDSRSELKKTGARPLRYFPNGPIKQHYVIVPQVLWENQDDLAFWAQKSIDYALTLPRPKASKRRTDRS